MSKELCPPITEDDHIRGDNGIALLDLVEYGDFQCSHCGLAYIIVKNLQRDFKQKLRYVFRHYPISLIHPDAFAAALAAEAAGLQNKFWEMHDLLFEHQQQLTWLHLLSYAKEIDIDVAQFKADFRSDLPRDKVKADLETGIQNGVTGTPTYFINGNKVFGRDEPILKLYLQEELDKAMSD